YTCRLGVGITPTFTTSHPLASRPQVTACVSISPLARVSRPSTTRPRPTYEPNACANALAIDGVKNSPTTPRTPETPILSRCSRWGVSGTTHLFDERVEQLAGRSTPL